MGKVNYLMLIMKISKSHYESNKNDNKMGKVNYVFNVDTL